MWSFEDQVIALIWQLGPCVTISGSLGIGFLIGTAVGIKAYGHVADATEEALHKELKATKKLLQDRLERIDELDQLVDRLKNHKRDGRGRFTR